MKLTWAEQAWEDYLYWQKTDKKILRQINRIIAETKRNPLPTFTILLNSA